LNCNTRNRHGLIALFITLLILFELASYLTAIPVARDQYFQMYLLGANETPANYYPGNSSNLHVRELLQWHLGVVNSMGSLQYVSIRVRLGNQTIMPPNDTTGIPSQAPLVMSLERFVQDNETWQTSFDWYILNSTRNSAGLIYVSQLMIDNVTYTLANPLSCSKTGPCVFRLIFELWTWNVSLAQFQFGWSNGDERRTAWLEFWFSLLVQGAK